MTSAHRACKIKLLLGCATYAYDAFLSTAFAAPVPLVGCCLLRFWACIPIDTMAYVQIAFDIVTICIADFLLSGLVLHCCLHKGMHYDPSCTTIDELTSAKGTLLGDLSALAA